MSRSNPSAKMRKSARYQNQSLSISIDQFGPTTVCRTLASMINDNIVSTRHARRILGLIHKMTFTFRQLTTIADRPTRNHMFDLYRNHILDRAGSFDAPEIFKSYLKNVIHYWHSTYLNGIKNGKK